MKRPRQLTNNEASSGSLSADPEQVLLNLKRVTTDQAKSEIGRLKLMRKEREQRYCKPNGSSRWSGLVRSVANERRQCDCAFDIRA